MNRSQDERSQSIDVDLNSLETVTDSTFSLTTLDPMKQYTSLKLNKGLSVVSWYKEPSTFYSSLVVVRTKGRHKVENKVGLKLHHKMFSTVV